MTFELVFILSFIPSLFCKFSPDWFTPLIHLTLDIDNKDSVVPPLLFTSCLKDRIWLIEDNEIISNCSNNYKVLKLIHEKRTKCLVKGLSGILNWIFFNLWWVKNPFGSTLWQHKDIFHVSALWDRQQRSTCKNQNRHEGCESETTFTFKLTSDSPARVHLERAWLPTSEMLNQMLGNPARVNTNPWWVLPSLCCDVLSPWSEVTFSTGTNAVILLSSFF